MLYWRPKLKLIPKNGVVFIENPSTQQMVELIDLSDKEVLAFASQGDQEAFGALYERYVGRI